MVYVIGVTMVSIIETNGLHNYAAMDYMVGVTMVYIIGRL